jgi:TPP-dependent pyruvate/acetoin dehydrogenase alpha subunit
MIRYQYQGDGVASLKKFAKQYSKDFLLGLFYKMYRIRLIEEAVAANYHKDEMKTPIHLAIGQEAAVVGSCAVIENKDLVYCSHRTHGVYLAKGGDINAMFAEFYCRLDGCTGSRGGSMHLMDKKVGMAGSSAIVGGAVPIATGFALSAKMQQKDSATIVYLGDASVEEGSVWESINFAVLKKLPIIYFCENNFYSVCSPIHYRQPEHVPIYKKAEGFGLKSERIDGNNVLAVYEASQRALQHIKEGEGPVFIEAVTYRWYGHHGNHVDFGYRTEEELAEWKKVDPVSMLKNVLVEDFKIETAVFDNYQQEIMQEIQNAFEFATNSPPPRAEHLMQYVYSE